MGPPPQRRWADANPRPEKGPRRYAGADQAEPTQQGFADNEIARVLAISGETVRFHLNNARRKAGARNRVHLAAMQLGIGGAPRD